MEECSPGPSLTPIGKLRLATNNRSIYEKILVETMDDDRIRNNIDYLYMFIAFS